MLLDSKQSFEKLLPPSARNRLKSAVSDRMFGTAVHAGYLQEKIVKGRTFFGANKYEWKSVYFCLRAGTLQKFEDTIGQRSSEQPSEVYDLVGATLNIKPSSKVMIVMLQDKTRPPITLRTDFKGDDRLWVPHFEYHITNAEHMQQNVKERQEQHISTSPNTCSPHPLPPPPSSTSSTSSSSTSSISSPALYSVRNIALSVAVDGLGHKDCEGKMQAVCGTPTMFTVHAPTLNDTTANFVDQPAWDEDWDDHLEAELILKGDISINDIHADVMWQNNEEEEEEEVRSMIGKYTVHTAGIWELHVKYHDVLTFGSPFSVTVVAAEPEPERCIVSGAGIKTIDPSSTTQTFQIQLMDQHGNVCGSDQYTNDIVGIMYTEQDVLPCNVEYKGAGVYALSYESNTGIVEEGGGEIQVSIDGVEVNDSPYTVTIGPNNSEQLNILLSKRLSVEDMANRGFMISPNKEEEQSHSAASSPPSSPSMSVRRDSLMQKMATRETVQALVERGILGPSAMVEQVAPANKNHRGVGKMIQQEAGHSPAYSSGSLWANAGNTQIIHTMDTNNSPNGGLNKEEVISMVQQTATRTKATLDRRPGPWASVAELLSPN